MAEEKKVITKKTAGAKPKKKGGVVVTQKGKLFITATFNNTIVTVTNEKGETIAWSSAGAKGFKGTRRATPYAGGQAVEDVARKVIALGLKMVDIVVKGPGPGRDAALRAVRSGGLNIASITDATPIPHNGPRAKKKRRV